MQTTPHRHCPLSDARSVLLVMAACSLSTVALGQTLPSAPASSTGASGDGVNATGRLPWSIGASQGFYRSSNVYRVPEGKSDVYSSTSLFGGVDQQFGRQRAYANGTVSLNRYRDEKELDNTSYSLGAGLAFETVMNLSGGLDVGLDQQLAGPAASTAESPQERRNLARTRRVDGRLVWGGQSVFTVETRAGYSRFDYADEAYAGSESSRREAGVTAFYRPGARLRVGLGLRADRTEQPAALRDPVSGAVQSNDIDGRHVDLLANYELTGLTSLGARLSYTRQSNSNPLLEDDDFSGLTGSFSVSYRATEKLTANLLLSRDTGTAGYGRTFYTVGLPPTQTTGPTTPIVASSTVQFENNRVTNAATFGVAYAATSKIGVGASIRHERASVASTSTLQSGSNVSDRSTAASLSVSYAVTRLASLGCSTEYERRSVSGGINFSYSVNTIGCNGSIRWP